MKFDNVKMSREREGGREERWIEFGIVRLAQQTRRKQTASKDSQRTDR